MSMKRFDSAGSSGWGFGLRGMPHDTSIELGTAIQQQSASGFMGWRVFLQFLEAALKVRWYLGPAGARDNLPAPSVQQKRRAFLPPCNFPPEGYENRSEQREGYDCRGHHDGDGCIHG